MFFGGIRLKRGWLRRGVRKLVSLDDRYGLFTVVLPLAVVCYTVIYVGVMALDRQKELRWLRVQSVSKRELALQEERELLEAVLLQTEDDYEFKSPPTTT
jgi:hypothetical protein